MLQKCCNLTPGWGSQWGIEAGPGQKGHGCNHRKLQWMLRDATD
jgi:hypothetical protein